MASRRFTALTAIGAFLVSGAPAGAKTNASVATPAALKALEACRAIDDAARRLACFDRNIAALLQATASGDLSVVDRAQMRQARKSLFGFAMPKLPFFAGDRSAEDDKGEIDSTISSARALGNGRFEIRIAHGGALWETLESYMAFDDPRKGQKIHIKRGPLGSYMLSINGQRGVKGKRVG